MKRFRMLVLALFSLALSGVVAVLAYRVLQRRLTTETVQVVVAAQKLALGARLAPEHLQVLAWPKASQLEGSFSDPKELVGRGVVVPMARQEPILEAKLAPTEAGAGLSSAIPEGMRAVAVKVDPVIGVGGFVLPGTRVDVILTGSPEDKWTKDTSKVILENVRVLSAGTSLEDQDGKPRDVPVVTLLVRPEESQKLALASVGGSSIQLALRNPLDLRHENPAAVKKEALYRGASSEASPPAEPARQRPAKAAAPAPTVLTVELIQGQKRDQMTFQEKRP
jgi:pilus assembly protein CpaB